MTMKNRVLAVQLGASETSAIEVKRWLDKWSIRSKLQLSFTEGSVLQIMLDTQDVSEPVDLSPGEWVVIRYGGVSLLSNEEFLEYFG